MNYRAFAVGILENEKLQSWNSPPTRSKIVKNKNKIPKHLRRCAGIPPRFHKCPWWYSKLQTKPLWSVERTHTDGLISASWTLNIRFGTHWKIVWFVEHMTIFFFSITDRKNYFLFFCFFDFWNLKGNMRKLVYFTLKKGIFTFLSS